MGARRPLKVCESSAERSAGKRSRNVGASERWSVGAESGWSRRGSNYTSNEMAMVRDADDGRSQVDVRVHHAYITYIVRTSRTSRVHHVHHTYITHTLRAHCAYVACVSLYITCRCEGCRWAKVWWWQRAGKRSGGKAESERGKAERSGNVGKRSSQKGVPLTITPPLEKHRP